MDTGNSVTDELRHVKFVGRSTSSASRSSRQVRSSAFAKARAVPVRRNERPGEFISWIFHRAGLNVECYRGEALGRRMASCFRVLRAHSEEEARQVLERRPELLPAAVSALLIGVTDFFRDDSVFTTLRVKVLPELSRLGRTLRVWSAGCSTGEELYSMAMLLAQAGMLEGSFLLGTDCRVDAIGQARDGLYDAGDLKPLDSMMRHKYFEAAGDRWSPIDLLRRHVHWKTADLNRRVEPGPWDIILWRNMGIYLTAEAAESAWRRLTSALSPEGVIVVGKASRPPEKMRLHCIERCLYRVRAVASGM